MQKDASRGAKRNIHEGRTLILLVILAVLALAITGVLLAGTPFRLGLQKDKKRKTHECVSCSEMRKIKMKCEQSEAEEEFRVRPAPTVMTDRLSVNSPP